MVGRLLSFWEGLFSGAMLVSGRVFSKEIEGRENDLRTDITGFS